MTITRYTPAQLEAMATAPHEFHDTEIRAALKVAAAQARELERLPRTADGVPMMHGDGVWVLRDEDEGSRIEPDQVMLEFQHFNAYEPIERAYSTRAAAQSASASKGGG